jgi:hypothetical protein
MRREQGSILPILLALLAAMALTTTLVARHGLQEHRMSRQSYLRPAPQAALNEGLTGSGLRATLKLVRQPLPGGKLRLEATAELEPGGLRYRIEAVTRRGPGGEIETVAWTEQQLH